jgi:uncharacterized membrane protein (UPF0127 family)
VVTRPRIGAVVALFLALTAAAASAGGTRTVLLRLDGAPIRPELALTPSQRAVGLMHRRAAPADGMLFVFPASTRDGFWMKSTLVPLTVVFFDATGTRVRRLVMTPCHADPCPVYYPRRTYRFALELPAGDTRPARTLGPRPSLARLARRAT